MDLEKLCKNDGDCGQDRYCYKISRLCVQFTNCTQYNREKKASPARKVSECGPCIDGYATENFTNGEQSPFCQRNDTSIAETGNQTNLNGIICSLISIFIIFVVGVLLYFVIKRYFNISCHNTKCCNRKSSITRTAVATSVLSNAASACGSTIPTAPVEEKRPFIDCAEDKHIYNNNRRCRNNEYQNATVNVMPVWGTVPVYITCTSNANRTAPRFGSVPNNALNDDPNGASNNVSQENMIAPDERPALQTSITMSEVHTEQEDNTRNITLLQFNSSNSDENPPLEFNEGNKTEKKNVFIKQELRQNIQMNVNVA
ncbi:hypothetical protein PUN28_002747 [Cardiocondyla obscurior]|uniref:Uncharacterized protein n=1 Tax=Cardiocondyla obscurior TaxID=286306 RepID=A0AAW2GW19_9HYME